MTNRIENTKAVITRVVRYVDEVYHRNPDGSVKMVGGFPVVRHEQRMGAVWFVLDDDASTTCVSFVKRSGGLWSVVKEIEQQRFGGRVDSLEIELGEVVNIRSAIVKKKAEAIDHKGEHLPERLVLTHIKLGDNE